MAEEDVASYDRDGYLQIRDLLASGEVQRNWDELGRLSTDPAAKADERTVVKKTSNDVRVRRRRITPGVAAGAGDRHPGPRLVALARPPAGQPPVHWAARLGTDVRLQHDARLGEQHHPVPTLEHLHRVQQRRERPGRAVRGRVTTPNVGRQPSLHAGRLTEVRSAHVGGQQVDSVLGNEGGALPHVEGQ